VEIIYFKCSCGKVLAVDETGVGRTVKCPDCGQSLVVPSPEIRWNCQTCDHEMAAPGEIEGQKVQCAECLNYVTVPVIMPALKHRNSPKCPDCGADINPDVVLCINCGLNLKPGEKIKSVFEDHNSHRRFPIRMTVIPAIAFVVLCTLAFAWWRIGTATNTSGKPPPEPSRARQPMTVPDQTIPKEPLPPPVPPVIPTSEPVTPAPVIPEPKNTSSADSLAIENDTRALKAVIANIASIPDYALARDTLQSSTAKHPRAANMKEAADLLLRLQQAVNVGNAISNCSSYSKRDAARMLEDAVNKNSMAPNLSQAQAPLSKLRQELHDTDALAMVLENARTNENRQYAIRLLKDAAGRYRQATNMVVAEELLKNYQQAAGNVRTNIGTSSSPLTPASPTTIMDNIAVIRTKEGAGTGFVLNINGKKFLVTNRHVIAGAEAQEISFDFISGKKPKTKSFEIAKDIDLVRFEIDSSFICNGLALSPTPNKQVGDEIIVYGNSQGAGAVTELRGRILGWGPNVIETSAQFVSGNSGSPIIDNTHNVVGVATFATQDNSKDWVIKGTRFEEVRRFGLRLDNVEWHNVEYNEFARQSAIITEADIYLSDFVCIYMFCCFKTEDKTAISTYSYYNKMSNNEAKKRSRWSYELIALANYNEKAARGGMSGVSAHGMGRIQLMKCATLPKQLLKDTKWIDKYYGEEAKRQIEFMEFLQNHINKTLVR